MRKTKDEQIVLLQKLYFSGWYSDYTYFQDDRYAGGLLYVGIVEVGGFKGALHGMRNPKNSWRLNDTEFSRFNGLPTKIGEKDLKLAQTLIKAGTEHCKFLRQIQVTMDLNLPRYLWSELDTYHYNTKNSCSTMHKLINADDEKEWKETLLDELLAGRGEITIDNFFYSKEDEFELFAIVERLNSIRKQYLETTSPTDRKHLRRRAKQLLPESFLQMRTMTTNYAELRNIYLQRRHHLLDTEWGVVCQAIRQLPFAKELILYGIED